MEKCGYLRFLTSFVIVLYLVTIISPLNEQSLKIPNDIAFWKEKFGIDCTVPPKNIAASAIMNRPGTMRTASMPGGCIMIHLETERLLLRNVQPEDVAVIYDYRNNEICARYQRGQVKNLSEISALVERHLHDTLSVEAPAMVAVALKATNEMVGEIQVMPNDGAISLGYTFHYNHHRKGYAMEALSTLTELLHSAYPEWEFISFTEPENKPSMALLRKLGYRDLGYVPQLDSQMFGKWLKQE